MTSFGRSISLRDLIESSSRLSLSYACVFGVMLSIRLCISSSTIFTQGVGRVGIVKGSPSSPSFQLQRIREMVYSRRERSTTSRNETKRKWLHMVEPCIHEFDGWRDQGHIFTVQSSGNLNRSSNANLNHHSFSELFIVMWYFQHGLSCLRELCRIYSWLWNEVMFSFWTVSAC